MGSYYQLLSDTKAARFRRRTPRNKHPSDPVRMDEDRHSDIDNDESEARQLKTHKIGGIRRTDPLPRHSAKVPSSR